MPLQNSIFLDDPVNSVTDSSLALLSFSIGYFLFDTCNMMLDGPGKWIEIIVHHLCVIIIFALAVSLQVCVVMGATALMLEVNTVFLHARTLLLMMHKSKNSLSFRISSVLNILTFIPYRNVLMAWMTKIFFGLRMLIPSLYFYPAFLGFLFLVSSLIDVVDFINILYFRTSTSWSFSTTLSRRILNLYQIWWTVSVYSSFQSLTKKNKNNKKYEVFLLKTACQNETL